MSGVEGRAGKVYDYLRDAIIEGQLAPGTRLLERDLSERLGVSRIPVRDALPRLEAEGLVVAGPRRGSVVASMTVRDVEELFDVRTSLETLAARLAARRARHGASAATDRLATALARAEVATGDGRPGEIASANAALHEAVVALAGNQMLTGLMAPINARVRWLFRLTSDRDPHLLCQEHRELCEAILGGHVELAAGLALVHVERGRAPSLTSLAGLPPTTPEVPR